MISFCCKIAILWISCTECNSSLFKNALYFIVLTLTALHKTVKNSYTSYR